MTSVKPFRQGKINRKSQRETAWNGGHCDVSFSSKKGPNSCRNWTASTTKNNPEAKL